MNLIIKNIKEYLFDLESFLRVILGIALLALIVLKILSLII